MKHLLPHMSTGDTLIVVHSEASRAQLGYLWFAAARLLSERPLSTVRVVFSTSVTRPRVWWQSRNRRFLLSEQVDYWTCTRLLLLSSDDRRLRVIFSVWSTRRRMFSAPI